MPRLTENVWVKKFQGEHVLYGLIHSLVVSFWKWKIHLALYGERIYNSFWATKKSYCNFYKVKIFSWSTPPLQIFEAECDRKYQIFNSRVLCFMKQKFLVWTDMFSSKVQIVLFWWAICCGFATDCSKMPKKTSVNNWMLPDMDFFKKLPSLHNLGVNFKKFFGKSDLVALQNRTI